MPLELQSRLLRVLENRTVKRVGGTEPVERRRAHSSPRPSATWTRLVESGAFRRGPLLSPGGDDERESPALRERTDDLPVLISDMLLKSQRTMRKMLPETAALLCDYAWPGNVRELRNVLEVAASLEQEPQLPEHSRRATPAGQRRPWLSRSEVAAGRRVRGRLPRVAARAVRRQCGEGGTNGGAGSARTFTG